MRLLHLSDTHGKHHELPNLPAADVIIHSGDLTVNGASSEFVDFIEWFAALDYPHKIFIAGNHDSLENAVPEKLQQHLPKNMHYLSHSGVTIDGVRFWGVPYLLIDEGYTKKIAQIPPDIDVLISHNPPLGILDFSDNINYGCPHLLQKVLEIQPRYHLFGHIHSQYGMEESKYTTFVNAAVMNENELVNEAVELEIIIK